MVVKENFFSSIRRKRSLLRALAAFWASAGKSGLRPEKNQTKRRRPASDTGQYCGRNIRG